jgi:hypothetical protein
MHGRDMYGRYRQLIERLANCDVPRATWFAELQAIMRQLDLDADLLARLSARLLYDELGEQFERQAFQSMGEHRRRVLMAAVKLLEFQQSSLDTKGSRMDETPH